jgi:hypothetical protein
LALNYSQAEKERRLTQAEETMGAVSQGGFNHNQLN